MKIRTRFAPSPTGYLHIGSVRTALYSWLFARKQDGEFILRIEDTDLERSTPEAIQVIMDSMNWLNLKWDKGPYFQSERFYRYNSIIDFLLESGKAYKCFCSKDRLKELREKQKEKGEKTRYDGYCRFKHSSSKKESPYVVRFANPQEGSVIFNDLIRGPIKFNNRELDDLVIRRSDRSPTYNFCVVVDDWDMAITHVIRGEEHISNTPRQINILKALNAPIPIYAHVSVINGNDGKKLSKRHGAVNIMQYREEGFLPEALLNYLVRLGWSYGDREIFSLKEMIALFSMNSIHKSSSIFNHEKLLWLNHHYINTLPVEYIATHLKWHLDQENISICDGPQLSEIVKLLSKRCKTLKEMVKKCRYFYEDLDEIEIDQIRKYLNQTTSCSLKLIRDKLMKVDNWTVKNIRDIIYTTANESKVKIGDVGMPLRFAVTGSGQSPELDKTIYAIGKDRSVSRIDKILNFIDKNKLA